MQVKKAKKMMSDAQVEEAARLFGLLAEAARLYLLRALMAGPESVGGLVKATGMRQGTVSKHLGILHSGGFLLRRRLGLNVIYEIADPALYSLCELMCERIQRDAEGRFERLAG